MKTYFLSILLIVCSVCLLPSTVLAQGLGQENATVSVDMFAQVQTPWLVVGRVRTNRGAPVRGATVTVSPLIAVGARMLATNAEGEFRTEYRLNSVGVNEFNVVLTVKKKGLQTAHAYVSYARSATTWEIPVTLRTPDDDPAMLSSEELVSTLAPRLRQLGITDGLSEKSEKDYTRGVADFLDQNHPEKAVPSFARVVERDPACIACRAMLGLAELGWNDMDDGNRSLAESVNATLADRTKGRPEPLVAYGTWLNWQHDPEKAEPFFLEALKYTPKDALALRELGRTRLEMHKYELATDPLKKALDAGAGEEARLLYAEALVGAGRPDEAGAELKKYLGDRDVKKMPMRVRQVWANIQNRQKVEATYSPAKPQKSQHRVDFLQNPPAELTAGLEPAKDQAELNSILEGAGAKIVELLADFPNTSSLEAIHQEKLVHKPGPADTQHQKFRYLCIVPNEKWGPGFIEYRADFDGNLAMPKGLSEGFMLTQGFNSTALFFHPSYRAESNFHYLGRQNINGRSADVLAFAQIPGRAHLTGTFRKNQTSVTTLSQGLAWIDTETHQIVRIHTELLAPLPEIQLDKQSMDVDFHEVRFASLNKAVWLPEDVTVTLDWNGKRLRNRHEYSDFKVFDVNATEKIGQPKNAGESSHP